MVSPKSFKEGHVKMRTKQANTHNLLKPPETGRGRRGFFPKVFRGILTLFVPLFQSSGLQNYERIKFIAKSHLVYGISL